MSITIRQLSGQEMLEELYILNSYALHPSPPYQNKQEWEAIVRERKGVTCHAAYEDGQAVSIAVTSTMTQNIRGKLFPACGVWGVSTSPKARRKGYCKQVMGSLMSSDHEAGKVISNLYPFRESFYERMGYVAYPLMKIAKFSACSLVPTLKMKTGGEIKLRYIGEAYDEYRQYLARMREHQHGMAFFDFGDRGRVNQNLFWIATAMYDGEVEGLMMYRTLGQEVTKYQFSAGRFYYQSTRARYLMLNWIARHIDQVEQIEFWLAADEYPETWLSDLQVKIEGAERPAMSRILDIEKLKGMLAGEGSFSAKIIDTMCPWNEGAWIFGADSGRLEVTRTSTAECELTIQGLTALVSGVHNPQDFPLRGWGDPSSDIQARMRAVFPKRVPYMHEMF